MPYETFIFYSSFARAAKKMSDCDRLALYDAIINYSLDNDLPEGLTGLTDIAWELIKPQLDANKRKAENGKYGQLGAEYGKLGGRPKKEDTQEPPAEPEKAGLPITPEGVINETPKGVINYPANKNLNSNSNTNSNLKIFTKNSDDPQACPSAVADETGKAIIPLSQSPPTKKSNKFELTNEQLVLFHAAKACFESNDKTKKLLYQDRQSTSRYMKQIKTLVVRCSNMVPDMSADFMRNVLEHFQVICNGKLKGKAEFSPQALMTNWIWELVIGSLPGIDSPELKESMRGMFKK